MDRILIDAFGGDNSPNEIIIGAIDALKIKDGFKISLIGMQDKIEEILSTLSYDSSMVEIIPASEVITCEEKPVNAIMRKKDSTFNVGFKVLKEEESAKAFISAGSTGAYLVGATLKLGRIEGVDRPALSPVLPTIVDGKRVILLDAGANADCKSINLVQFAYMGVEYAKALGVKEPKVALLSNGTEEAKGNSLTIEVNEILKNSNDINFVGNIEARDILSGEIDVVVADGFSGNVALKSLEGGVKAFTNLLKGEIYSSFKNKIAGLLLKKSFKKLYEKMDYNRQGGALLLGVNKAVIKIHGSSKRKAITGAVLQASGLLDFDLSDSISKVLSKNNAVK